MILSTVQHKIIMFIFLVSLLGLLYGALGMEEACLYKAQRECRIYSVVQPFPGSEEELQNACTNLNQIKECIKDSVSNCRAEDAEDIEENDRLRQNLKDYQKLLNVTTEICQEDSELHEKFAQDMLCYREVFETNNREQHCRDYTDNALNYIRSRTYAKYQEMDIDVDRVTFRECLHVLLDMNCFLEKFVDKCSSDAKDTAIDIIEKGGSLEDQCPVSIRIDILELLDTLKVVSKREIYARELMEVDSFFT